MHRNLILLLIALFLALFALLFRKYHRRNLDATKYKSIPITRRRLIWTANKHNIFSILAMDLSFALIFTVVYLTGRMEIVPVLIACGVCFILALLIFLPAFFLQAGAWKTLKSIEDFDVLTQGKTLEYDNGEWCYSDRRLMICISRRSTCILYSPFIDFPEKFFYERNSSSISGSKASSSMRFMRFVIPLKGGGKSKQLLAFNRVVSDWIHSHGGHISGAD